jgi:hypothetical protein
MTAQKGNPSAAQRAVEATDLCFKDLAGFDDRDNCCNMRSGLFASDVYPIAAS